MRFRGNKEELLRDTWTLFTMASFLGARAASVNFHVGHRGKESFQLCARLVERLMHKFQKRWLHEHVCPNCAGRAFILDGNAKVPTRLCANSDDGTWSCRPLQAHCLTGCQRPPIPGKISCSLQLKDAEPFFGSDLKAVHHVKGSVSTLINLTIRRGLRGLRSLAEPLESLIRNLFYL